MYYLLLQSNISLLPLYVHNVPISPKNPQQLKIKNTICTLYSNDKDTTQPAITFNSHELDLY